MQITDRSKDVIKSGGEWISSIDLENLAVGHPASPRPPSSACRIPNGTSARCWSSSPSRVPPSTRETVLALLEGKIAKWWMPDDVAFVDEIPHTATGKISKLNLREQFKDYVLPTAG
jgi:acyl-CoA synthetase (AMP-forming)/AMP-acid ligase II